MTTEAQRLHSLLARQLPIGDTVPRWHQWSLAVGGAVNLALAGLLLL